MSNEMNITTGRVRLSYVHLFKPYAAVQGQEEKYSCTVLVPKTDVDTMNRINAAIAAAREKGTADKWGGQCPPMVQIPIHDGDGPRPSDGMPFGPECRGHWVFTASAKVDYPPEVVDKMGNPIINQSEIYSGIYGRVNVTFYPYSYGGKKGIGCGLGPVQKLDDGEALAGNSVSAEQAFGVPQPAAPAQPQTAGQMYGIPNGVPTPQPHTTGQMYGAPNGVPTPQPQMAGAVNPITGQPM